MNTRSTRKAFTVIELIFIVVILSLVAAVVAPKLKNTISSTEAASFKAEKAKAIAKHSNTYTPTKENW